MSESIEYVNRLAQDIQRQLDAIRVDAKELTDEELLAYSKFMRRTLGGFVGLRQKTGKVVEFQHDGRCPECGDPLAVEPDPVVFGMHRCGSCGERVIKPK